MSEPGQGSGGRQPAGDMSVRRFGKYYLVKKLAEGGMAEIFLAKQVGVEGFEKNIVIKRMLAHLSAAPDFVSMFLDEARLASRLGHPNVVQIHDLGFEEGCYFIAMEYLAGEDFSTVVRSHARKRSFVPIHIVLRVLAEAAHGLHFAHDFTDAKGVPLNIVHRDVSPSNIFVTYNGQVKVLDFGIAKAESRLTTTTAGVVKGKYQYMSPEQAGSGAVDRRADVYSLGVCLYESLTNHRPFARDTDLAILNAVLKNEYKPPRELRPDLPLEMEHIITTALALHPEDRYQSAADLAKELEGYLRSMTSSTSGSALAQFMASYFGPDRVASRTRISTLDELREAAPPQDGQPPDVPLVTPVDVPITEGLEREKNTPTVGPPKSVVAARPSRGPLMVGAVVSVALASVVVTAAVMRHLGRTSTAELDAAVEAAKVPDAAAVAPPVVDSGAGAVSLLDAGPPEDAGHTVVAAKVEADAGAHLPSKPVTLTLGLITGVVKRNTGPVMQCFQQHKAELPSNNGTIGVRFTIASSGRVTKAQAETTYQNVGRCLEERVKAIRFPAHVDTEVTVTLPFAYQVR